MIDLFNCGVKALALFWGLRSIKHVRKAVELTPTTPPFVREGIIGWSGRLRAALWALGCATAIDLLRLVLR
jgi:hypothetical protein